MMAWDKPRLLMSIFVEIQTLTNRKPNDNVCWTDFQIDPISQSVSKFLQARAIGRAPTHARFWPKMSLNPLEG